jgi:hypothetical protein
MTFVVGATKGFYRRERRLRSFIPAAVGGGGG